MAMNKAAAVIPKEAAAVDLFSEIFCYFLHPFGLGYLEGAAPVAMTAGDAVRGLFVKLFIVISGKAVTYQRKIIVFIYKADIKSRRARPAVIAVNASPCDILGTESSDYRVIPLLGRSLCKSDDFF